MIHTSAHKLHITTRLKQRWPRPCATCWPPIWVSSLCLFLAGVVISTMTIGCLVTSPIIEQPDQNTGPFINVSQVDPTPGRQVVRARYDGPIRFSIPYVEDADLDDIITARWFVNYERNGSLFHTQTIYPSGAVNRPGISFVLDICRSDLRNLSEILVEVDLSDRGFLDDSPDLPFRGVEEDAKVLTLSWLIIPLQESACPTSASSSMLMEGAE